jgi:hypothetical protein
LSAFQLPVGIPVCSIVVFMSPDSS